VRLPETAPGVFPNLKRLSPLRARASQLRQNAKPALSSAQRERRANCRKSTALSGHDHAAGIGIHSISLRD